MSATNRLLLGAPDYGAARTTAGRPLGRLERALAMTVMSDLDALWVAGL